MVAANGSPSTDFGIAGIVEPMPEDATIDLHVPLTPTPGLTEDEYRFPWIHELEDAISALEDDSVLEMDDADEQGDNYVFTLTGASEERLLAAAGKLANLDGVPAGAFAMVDDRRVELND